ncbi:LysR family transcriptional regulator [Phenylobacterium terrae]|uniref:LysR family transcriptional regulator n=1 Tax=Phenylobacterium terrae TaxID=2665495 RepID=A0ABW4MZL9_9CAUL
MNLAHLSNFVRIAEAQSLSKAASIIRIAQPALSRQVKTLEAELGAPLLVRHAWGVTLTPAGQSLLESARRILRDVQQAQEAIEALENEPVGAVTLGAPSSLATALYPRLLPRIRQKHPKVRLRLIDALSGGLHQRTLAGEIDLAILHNDRSLGPLAAAPLLEEPLGLIGSAAAIDALPPLDAQLLASLPLIAPTGSNRSRKTLEAIVGDPAGQLVAEVDCLPAMLQMVAAGMGFCILPYSSIEADAARGVLAFRSLPAPTPARDMVLVHALDRPPTLAAHAVEAELRRLVAELAPRMRWAVA